MYFFRLLRIFFTAARYGLTPIVVVLDNNGYGTERPMLDGCFNDVHACQAGPLYRTGAVFLARVDLADAAAAWRAPASGA